MTPDALLPLSLFCFALAYALTMCWAHREHHGSLPGAWLGRLWFHLTHSTRCSWCQRTLRRAWLHMGWTDTICASCKRELAKTKRAILDRARDNV